MEQNIVLKNVTFTWAKLAEPVKPFDKLVWELTVSSDNPEDDLQRFGKVRFDKENRPSVVLHKRADKADGTRAPRVTVLDKDGNDLDPQLIGNGSMGHVKVFMRNWEWKGKKGVSATLMAVKVTKLVEYRPNSGIIGFDEGDDADDGNGGTVKVPAGAKVSRYSDDQF